jgi:hypothetical protein
MLVLWQGLYYGDDTYNKRGNIRPKIEGNVTQHIEYNQA